MFLEPANEIATTKIFFVIIHFLFFRSSHWFVHLIYQMHICFSFALRIRFLLNDLKEFYKIDKTSYYFLYDQVRQLIEIYFHS